MSLWVSEIYDNDTTLNIKVKEQLFSGASEFQKIEIYDTYGFGRMLFLDDKIMFSQSTEFVYHELISHVPLFVHPNPKNVLVIGGGDGGTVRELLKHESVESVDLVEIDGMVVETSKKYFPEIAGELGNPRVNVLIEDGIKFVKTKSNHYDVIIIDSTDPIGPGEGLFTREFYGDCKKAMTDGAIMVAQTESPFYYPDVIRKLYKNYNSIFSNVNMYIGAIPVYPSGTWSFCFCSDKFDPIKDFSSERVEAAGFVKDLKYYNKDLHTGCFAVPNFAKELVTK